MLFFLTGMSAAYFDFFTTETITVLIPLLLALRILLRHEFFKTEKEIWLFAGKCIVLWGLGYVATWSMKWGLAAIVLRENTMQYVQRNFGIHLGAYDTLPTSEVLRGAILRNVWPLFPVSYGLMGAVISFAMVTGFVFIPIYRSMVAVRKEINWGRIALYAALGLIPYIRFLVLRHHSYRHYFFTYRAQAATVMALCFAIAEVVQINRKPTHTEPMPIK